MKILITGGSGFIGTHTVEIGRSVGHEITNLDISGNSDISESIVNIDWSELGLQNYDAVIHLAALVSVPESFNDPSRYHEVNVEATRRLFMSCVESGIKKVIFSSSAAVYSTLENPDNFTTSPYSNSKILGERHARNIASSSTKFTIFRFFNVYGPGQEYNSRYSSVIPMFVKRIVSGQPITIFGDGRQTRDFIHVSDIAKTLISSLEKGHHDNFQLFDLGSGVETSVNELLSLVISSAKEKGVEINSEIIHEAPRKGDIRHSIANTSNFSSICDPRLFLSLKTGIDGLLDEEIKNSVQ